MLDLDEVEAIRKTGRWWDIPWWTDRVYLEESGLPTERIDSAFATLREIFSDEWVKEQVDGHPMLPELFGSRGLSPFTFLYKLGDDLRILQQQDLLGNLRRRLRNIGEFGGARAELRALAQWAEVGVKIRRTVPSGNGNRNCDWKVSDGGVVIYGEVKCVELAQVNRRREILDVPPWEREPVPFDLAAEGDKMMDVVEANADQIPSVGPGIFMISGSAEAAALPFSDAAGVRIVERFRAANNSLRHIAGILVIKTFLFPEHGLVQFAILVQNPCGLELSLNLLKRGFPELIVWPARGSGAN